MALRFSGIRGCSIDRCGEIPNRMRMQGAAKTFKYNRAVLVWYHSAAAAGPA